MIVPTKAAFVTSAPTIRQAPPASVSEVAFVGRSNVGKSSLLNALAGRKGLAKSSATPGKTNLINFFDIEYKLDERRLPLRFVDLPGYGYAKASKSLKREWQKHLSDFLGARESIRVFVHLIDARHPELEIDRETAAFLEAIARGDQKILRVYTKADKLKQKERAMIKRIDPEALLVSSVTKEGIEELKHQILEHIFGDNIPQTQAH